MSAVSVVTGAAGAMGAACARRLGPAADALLLTDRDDAGLRAAADALPAAARPAVSVLVGDIADPAFLAKLAGRVAELGELGPLVHTAGLSPSMADWREILRVDLSGVARLLDAFVAQVVPGSVAVCLASIAAHLGRLDADLEALLDEPLAPDLAERVRSALGPEPDPGASYRLAKAGVIRLCQRAAVSWGARGGRVLSLSPGLIDTGMGRLELARNPVKRRLAELTPLRSARQRADAALPGHVADVAEAVAFLCSERASFVSGCDVRVDGGLVAAMARSGRDGR